MSAARAILTILRNGETVKAQPIESEAVLGRAEGCVIRLDDRAVSRQHAVFRPVANGVQVEKKSEFAPLVVNGIECTKAVLKEGDVISIGPYLVRLSMPPAEQAQAPAPAEVVDAPMADVIQMQPLDAVAQPAVQESPVAETPAAEPGASMEGVPGLGDARGAQGVQGDGAPSGLDSNNVGEVPGLMMDAGQGGAEIDVPSGGPVDEDGKTKIASTAKVSVKLIFQPGFANVTDYELTKDEVSIGRGKNCDIVLTGKKASRKHAVIRRAGLNFSIKDLESANGVYVNGVRVKEQELSGDDVIKIGEAEFQFKALNTDYAAQEQNFADVPDVPDPADAVDSAAAAPVVGVPIDGMTPMPDMAGIPGISGVPGIGESSKKQGLYEKYIKNFKNLPKKQRYMVIFVVGGLIYMLLDTFAEDPQPQKKAPVKRPGITAPSGAIGVATFESLSPEQKRFVEAQHALAFDHYRNKDFDKALYEIRKIFTLIPDYKDSKEIERYALEGKRKLEAIEEEKRKKEEEARLKVRIADLVRETGERMAKKEYEQAEELFGLILAIDPDNIPVANWKKEIEQIEEEKRLAAQAKAVQEEINKRAWEMVGEGIAFKKQGKYHSAIDVLGKVADIGASDNRPLLKAKKLIAQCRAIIKAKRDPVLAQAKADEDSGEFAKAFQLYKRATRIDPPHPTGYAGMNRIRGILHDKAKIYYTEAILAESYSDFETAQKKYNDCLATAPEDDIYYARAKHKLRFYLKKEGPVHEP